jgi:uncharacterized protein YcnI
MQHPLLRLSSGFALVLVVCVFILGLASPHMARAHDSSPTPLQNTNTWAKAGVMLRDGTAANTRFVMVVQISSARTVTLSNPKPGLAVTSHDNGNLSTATFSGVWVTSP